MTTTDIFTNVHKGIRKALFETCIALGRAGDDPVEGAAARALLRDALRFVAHHGENEDELLLPLLREQAPGICARMAAEHERIDTALQSLWAAIDQTPAPDLYAEVTAFTALYLQHRVRRAAGTLFVAADDDAAVEDGESFPGHRGQRRALDDPSRCRIPPRSVIVNSSLLSPKPLFSGVGATPPGNVLARATWVLAEAGSGFEKPNSVCA